MLASHRKIAKAIIDGRQKDDESMKEKLRALREYMGEERKKLSDSIDSATEFAHEVYPQAHDAVATQHDEVSGIMEELKELQDEANQAMGGNRPPKKDASEASAKSSEAPATTSTADTQKT